MATAVVTPTSQSFDASELFNFVWDTAGAELILALLFCTGFLIFRWGPVRRLLDNGDRKPAKGKKLEGQFSENANVSKTMLPAKQLEANWAAGRGDLVLEAWPFVERLTAGALNAVVEALIAADRSTEIPGAYRRALATNMGLRGAPEVGRSVLEAVPKSMPGVAHEVRQIMAQNQAKIQRQRENAQRQSESHETDHASQMTSAQALKVRQAVQDRELEKALSAIVDCCKDGKVVPVGCLVSVARLAREVAPERSVVQELPLEALSPEAVAALLELAVRASDVHLLGEVHLRASTDHIGLLPASCEALLRGYAASGDSHAQEAFDELLQAGFEPSEGVIAMAVSLCAESRHVQMAEHLVDYARRTNGRVPLALYSALMKVYSCARLFHKTCDLYATMQQDGIKPDTVVYGSLIKAAVESGRLDLARKLFSESGNPDLLNYMSLIRAAGREHDVPKALRILAELESSPLAVDATAYNCALEVCATCGNRVAGEELLARMESGKHVDAVSYNTYLKILFAEGAHKEVAGVLQRMQQHHLKPNVVTYNSLIKGAVMHQDIVESWRLTDEMEHAGVRPDAFTCSILMKGLRHALCAEDVDKIIALIERCHVVLDEVLVNCLLDACVRLRDVERLTQVLEQFKATGVVPSLHACATLIRAYGHARRPDRAWALWRELVSNGRLAQSPSEEVFASMVDACLAGGDLQGAASVFREMKERIPEFSRAAAIFSAMAKACVQCKRARLVLDLHDELKEELTCNKVTYNTLIDALVRQGEMTRASDIFKDMQLKAVTPDLITYSTLIKGHCAKGDLEEGLQLLGLMQRRGIAPDAILFNSILDGCAHKQMRSLTEQVLRDMETAGIAPSNFTLSILVKLYGRCADLAAASEVVDLYPEKYGFTLNAQVFTCLMSACIANGDLARAMTVYDKMKSVGCLADAKTYQTLISGCLRHSDAQSGARLIHDAVLRSPPVRVEREAVEGVLFLATRQGQVAEFAAPLLDAVQAANVFVSDRVIAAVREPNENRPYQRRAPTRDNRAQQFR